MAPRADLHPAIREASADDLAAMWLLGYSGHTRQAYAADLRDWGTWLTTRGTAPLSVRRAHVEAYARDLERRGMAAATVARRLATLAGFYGYAVDEGALDASPVRRVRRPRVDEDSPTAGLDRDELGRLLDIAEDCGPTDHALVCLLALNGLRVSEVLSADLEHLGHARGHRTLEVLRKGGKRGLMPLAPRTSFALDAALGDRVEGPLFIDEHGERLSRHTAARVIARLGKACGLVKQISPHSLRHTFVTLAFDAKVELRDIQDAAGHADPRTTRRYDRARHRLDRNPTYAVAAHVAETAA